MTSRLNCVCNYELNNRTEKQEFSATGYLIIFLPTIKNLKPVFVGHAEPVPLLCNILEIFHPRCHDVNKIRRLHSL